MKLNLQKNSLSQPTFTPDSLRSKYPWRAMLLGLNVFALVALTYLGMEFGYKTYLNSRIAALNEQVAVLDEKISSADQDSLLLFHSQIATLEYLLKNHPRLTGILSAVESSTLPEVYYKNVDVKTDGRSIAISGIGVDVLAVAEEARRLSLIRGAESVKIQSINRERNHVTFAITVTFKPGSFLYQQL